MFLLRVFVFVVCRTKCLTAVGWPTSLTLYAPLLPPFTFTFTFTTSMGLLFHSCVGHTQSGDRMSYPSHHRSVPLRALPQQLTEAKAIAKHIVDQYHPDPTSTSTSTATAAAGADTKSTADASKPDLSHYPISVCPPQFQPDLLPIGEALRWFLLPKEALAILQNPKLSLDESKDNKPLPHVVRPTGDSVVAGGHAFQFQSELQQSMQSPHAHNLHIAERPATHAPASAKHGASATATAPATPSATAPSTPHLTPAHHPNELPPLPGIPATASAAAANAPIAVTPIPEGAN
jgi:hypothetical protein